jgi:hypothetical protein
MTETHVLLSVRLTQLLAEPEGNSQALTLNQLLERTEGRGLFLVIVLLCLPFIAPVTIPGSSIPFGLAVALLAISVIGNRPRRLPRWIGDRAIPPSIRKFISGGGLKFLRWVERYAKPRRTLWLGRRWARNFHGALIVSWGLFLALPLPPIPPLGNTLPSYAIILLAASMMEEDGLLIWWAYGLTVFNLIYFSIWAYIIFVLLGGKIHSLLS